MEAGLPVFACAKQGKSQAKTYRLLKEIYGDSGVAKFTCHNGG